MGIAGDIYEGGGAKPVSWEEPGERYEGEIVAIRTKQLPKFGTQVPETWDDGSPKYTPIVTIQTSLQEDEKDDGLRDIYLRSNAYTAFGKALRETFKTRPDDPDLIGCTLVIQFHDTERSGKGQPRKLYRARIVRKSAADAAWDKPTTPKGGLHQGANPAPPPPADHPVNQSPPDDDIPF